MIFILCIYNTYNDIIIFKRICKIEGQNGYNKEDKELHI